MNREELKKYIDGLDQDAEIIVIRTREQAEVIPQRCERIDVPGRVLWVLKKVVHGSWKVAVVWVLLMDLFPGDIPKPKTVFVEAADMVSYVLKHIDYAFPYAIHDSQAPSISFYQNGNVHYLPASGFSREAVAVTAGIEISEVKYRA